MRKLKKPNPEDVAKANKSFLDMVNKISVAESIVNLFKRKGWDNILPDNIPVDFRNDPKIKKTECCKIPKGWGHELVIVNNEKYCGKILVFKQGFSFSMHYHLIKQETWYVNKGSFIFTWIDTDTGIKNEMDLNVGDVVTIPIGQPHQLRAKEDSEIFEISTQHFDSDSYRIWKGD